MPSPSLPREPLVGILMGSQSDWETMQHAAAALEELGIPHECHVMSAHRTPQRVSEYASGARARGLEILIAGAGGAAHLAGVVAALTPLPVFGVPIESKALKGLDSLLSMVQMPGGVPVGTLAIGSSGAKNAGLLAAACLALKYPQVRERLDEFRLRQSQAVTELPARSSSGKASGGAARRA